MRLWLLMLCLPACAIGGKSDVIVTSTPPGAEILVDSIATGQRTPAKLDLGGYFGGDHRITLRRPGYEDEHRMVYHYSQHESSRWVDGSTDPEVWVLPIFWTTGDFLTPFAVRWNYVPHELYVRLYPAGQAPVSSMAPETPPTPPSTAPTPPQPTNIEPKISQPAVGPRDP